MTGCLAIENEAPRNGSRELKKILRPKEYPRGRRKCSRKMIEDKL